MTNPTAAARVPPVGALAVGSRWSRWIVGATVVLTLATATLPQAALDDVTLLLVAIGLLAGLPHGSVDHRIAAELTGWPIPVVGGVYAALALLTWALLAVAGPIAIIAVVALSLAHFGLGELEVVRQTTGWRPSPFVSTAVAVAGTGALLLPLVRSGRQFSEVAAAISPELGVLLANAPVRIVLVGVWTIAAVVAAAAALRARQRVVVLDLVLVGALGAIAPPLVAFAVWFGGWHALRHCARLLSVDVRTADLLAIGRPRRAVIALARLAAWPTLAAVVVLAGLVAATVTASDPVAATGATLLVLLALTVPHMVVVMWLDRRQPVGQSGGRGELGRDQVRGPGDVGPQVVPRHTIPGAG